MLSRVADALFWMSRYFERAEHTARLLDTWRFIPLADLAVSAKKWKTEQETRSSIRTKIR